MAGVCIAVLAFLLLPAAALASDSGAALQCEAAALRAARASGVPEQVLRAIAMTETGRQVDGALQPWPWAVNLEGRGHWFASRAEAVAFTRRALSQGHRNFDVGCFQLNYRWHGNGFASLDEMFDPDVGAAYAAGFLAELHAEHRDWTRAAGAYHSRTPELAQAYLARFERNLAALKPLRAPTRAAGLLPTIRPSTAPAGAAPRGSLFAANGAFLRAASQRLY